MSSTAPSTTPFRLSNGPLPPDEAAAMQAVRDRLMQAEDSFSVSAVSRTKEGTWYYLITTNYPGWPQHVVGEYFPAKDDAPERAEMIMGFHIFQSAVDEWDRMNTGDHP